jgi:hypothetical protein
MCINNFMNIVSAVENSICQNLLYSVVTISYTVDRVLSWLMTGCCWEDNQRWPENDLLMRPYVYVKIIWWIISYSTLFILKRVTGDGFYFCCGYISQESFLKISVRNCLYFLLLFNFIDVRSLRSVKMSLKVESVSCYKNSNNVSGQFNNFFWKARLIKFIG